jgi:hypothetical protein
MRYQVKKNLWQGHPFPWTVVDTQLKRVARYTQTVEQAEELARQANAGHWEPKKENLGESLEQQLDRNPLCKCGHTRLQHFVGGPISDCTTCGKCREFEEMIAAKASIPE